MGKIRLSTRVNDSRGWVKLTNHWCSHKPVHFVISQRIWSNSQLSASRSIPQTDTTTESRSTRDKPWEPACEQSGSAPLVNKHTSCFHSSRFRGVSSNRSWFPSPGLWTQAEELLTGNVCQSQDTATTQVFAPYRFLNKQEKFVLFPAPSCGKPKYQP